MVSIALPYGTSALQLDIPDERLLGILYPRRLSGISNPSECIKRALEKPIGSKPIRELVSRGEKVSIVINDITRATPSHILLPPLLDEIEAAGVKRENVVIIVATGTHRAVSENEIVKLVGKDVLRRKIRVINHNCRAGDLVYVGRTSFGTDVYLNREFTLSDIKILTGDINLHYYAGYGGGRKSVVPGVAGEKTIKQNHALMLHPNASTGVLEGNPVHLDMTEAAKMANVDFILNVVLNEKKEIVHVVAGDLEKAFLEGVKTVDKMYKVPIREEADAVLVSAGGFPYDINLYQALKGAEHVKNAVKNGGEILLFAECSEGHGNDVFLNWMKKFKDLTEMEKEIKSNFVLGGHKAYYLLKLLNKANLTLISNLSKNHEKIFRVKIEQKLSRNLAAILKESSVYVVPYGSITLPYLA